jgi:hypothetical protein
MLASDASRRARRCRRDRALALRDLRGEGFADTGDTARHLVAAALMGMRFQSWQLKRNG